MNTKTNHIKSFNEYSRMDEGYKSTILSSILTLMSFFPKMSHAEDTLSNKGGYEYAQQVKKDYDARIQDLITKIRDVYPNKFNEYPFSQLKNISQKTELQKFDLKTLDEMEEIVNYIKKEGISTSATDSHMANAISDIIWSIRNNEEISDERISEIEKVINDTANRIEDSRNPSFFTAILILIGFLLAPALLLRELWITLSGRGGIPRY